MSVHPLDLRERHVLVSNIRDEPIPRSRPTNVYRKIFEIVLILAVLIAIVIGILMVIYIIRQDSKSKITLVEIYSDEEKKRNEHEKKILDKCIDTIWEYLLDLDSNQSNADYLQRIRKKVFHTLRHISPTYKRDLILFLYEHEFIHTDIPSEQQQLNLHGADLNNIQFENLNLNYLYLPGVIASNSLFHNCQLKQSNFQGSFMNKSRFIACSLEGSTFSGALLQQSLFTTNNNLSDIDFTNADLLGSNITISEHHNKNLTLNTRFPNGDFRNIDSKELINNGGAEVIISYDTRENWQKESGYESLERIPRHNDSCITMQSILYNNYYFQAQLSSRLIQDIDLTRYSTFIDSNQAWYNISAYLGCSNASSNYWSTVEVRFINKRKIYGNNKIHAIKYGETWRLLSNSSLIPIGIRTVQIMIGVYIQPLSENSRLCCGIDDVTFNIYQSHEKNSTIKEYRLTTTASIY